MTITSKSTQEFVPIKEIRDGVVILKTGSLRMILMASSLNFALKSEDEQTSIILQYQNFLNSLDFTVQFFIQSRKLNINGYIELLKDAQKEQTNELLKIQIKEYIDFIKNFVSSTNIVAKTFYIAIPYSPSVFSGKKGIFSGLGDLFGGKKNKKESGNRFEQDKLQLQQRGDVVRQGLSRGGVRTVPLNTEELIELFYKLFNPGEVERKIS